MLRNSASVPASSTPVAPPPTMVTVTSRWTPSRLSCSRPARMRARMVAASCSVYSAWLYWAAPVMPKKPAVTPVARMR